jgi:hypothetical protein
VFTSIVSAAGIDVSAPISTDGWTLLHTVAATAGASVASVLSAVGAIDLDVCCDASTIGATNQWCTRYDSALLCSAAVDAIAALYLVLLGCSFSGCE